MTEGNFIYKNKVLDLYYWNFKTKLYQNAAVIYENFVIETRFGDTHVIASGPKGVSNPSIILIFGFANLFADGFSMTAGIYLSAKSKKKKLVKENRKRDEWEIENLTKKE